MLYPLSNFGAKLSRRTGIQELMEDLGKGVADGDTIMMGGGNPAHIAPMEVLWQKRMHSMTEETVSLGRTLGDYDGPQGKEIFLSSLSAFLNRSCGWKIKSENLAVTQGSQNGFFLLFNMLAGRSAGGLNKKILFPLCPEYIGYADQGIEENLFTAFAPAVEITGKRRFKYRINFDRLKIGPEIAALCVSRPTNPTGNVITDEEVSKLALMCSAAGVPLILDNAYGLPFPGIVFKDASLQWHEQIIHTWSLSKLGLPASRTGIIAADKDFIQAFSSVNAIANLANGGVGQAIVEPLLADQSLEKHCLEIIKPFYQAKMEKTLSVMDECLPENLPWSVHEPEGAFFMWLNFAGLPGGDVELYRRLKARNVIVVPGSYFFPGLDEDFKHKNECIRISYVQSEEKVKKGIQIIGEEVRKMYN